MRNLSKYFFEVDEDDDGVLERDKDGYPVRERPRPVLKTRASRATSMTAEQKRTAIQRLAYRRFQRSRGERLVVRHRPSILGRPRAARQPRRVVRVVPAAVGAVVSGAGDGPTPPCWATCRSAATAEVSRG